MNNPVTKLSLQTEHVAGLILKARQSASLAIDEAKHCVDRLLEQTEEDKSQDTGERSDAENQQDNRTTRRRQRP